MGNCHFTLSYLILKIYHLYIFCLLQRHPTILDIRQQYLDELDIIARKKIDETKKKGIFKINKLEFFKTIKG